MLADATAIEVKAREPVGERDLRGMRALKEKALPKYYVAVSLEPRPRTVDGIQILPSQEFLGQLWAGAFAEHPPVGLVFVRRGGRLKRQDL